MSKNNRASTMKKKKRVCVLASFCKLHYICRKCNRKHHISVCIFEPSEPNPPSQEDSIEASSNNFSAIKTLFYYKLLWPQQQTYLENYTQKHFCYLAVGVKEFIFPLS